MIKLILTRTIPKHSILSSRILNISIMKAYFHNGSILLDKDDNIISLKNYINNLEFQNMTIPLNGTNKTLPTEDAVSISDLDFKDESYIKSLVKGLYSHTHSHGPETVEHNHHHHEHNHHHSHSHTLNNPLLVLSKEEIRKNAGVRITWVGLGVNVGIAIGKFIGGIVFHSQALFADSIHALSDMVSDFLTLFSVRLAANKPTDDYPYGYGKIETIGSLAVSTILMTAGISIGWSSLCGIVGPIIPHSIIESLTSITGGHSHSHVHSEDVTDINAAWIAAASIAAKEWIYRATKTVAIQTKSNVLMANAWHHRVDSLTSLVALVTISSGYLFNIQSLDMIGGLIVSAMVVKAGTEGMRVSINELLDKSMTCEDPRYIEIEMIISNALNKLPRESSGNSPCKLTDLMVLSSGPNLLAHAKISIIKDRDNVSETLLGIKELGLLTNYLRRLVFSNVSNFKKLEIEYLEDRPDTQNSSLKSYYLPAADSNHNHIHSHSNYHNANHGHSHSNTIK